MFLFLSLNLSHLWYFDIICANVIYSPGEKNNLYLLVFAPIKDFFDKYNQEHLGQMWNTWKLPKN